MVKRERAWLIIMLANVSRKRIVILPITEVCERALGKLAQLCKTARGTPPLARFRKHRKQQCSEQREDAQHHQQLYKCEGTSLHRRLPLK